MILSYGLHSEGYKHLVTEDVTNVHICLCTHEGCMGGARPVIRKLEAFRVVCPDSPHVLTALEEKAWWEGTRDSRNGSLPAVRIDWGQC